MDVFFVTRFQCTLYRVARRIVTLFVKKKNNFSRWDINIVEF